MTRSLPRRDERGLAFPSPLVMLSVVAVAMAALAFVLTGHRGDTSQLTPPAALPAAASPSATAAPTTPAAKPRKKPAVQRGQVLVEVFNNSGVTGLAAREADDIKGAGWNVIGTDNWFGTIPATTVYYPQRLAAAGKALARDLGIGRVLPAVDPMRLDRLTVILTSDRS